MWVEAEMDQLGEVRPSNFSYTMCEHLSLGESSTARERYESAVRWSAQTQGAKKRKVSPPSCAGCSRVLSRPWTCLSCDWIGCGPVASSSKCTQDHCGAGCRFVADTSTGAVYCAECKDAVYPDDFQSLFYETRVRVEEEHDMSREASRNRKRANYTFTPPEGSEAKTSCRGLRPLLNLSQTCFLSAILQSLIHNPLFKSHFLSEKHNRHTCAISRGLAVGKPEVPRDGAGLVLDRSQREKGCMCCEMDRAFEEFYNEDKSPFGPVTMLYSMWHASSELEGHGQQDAHSFFLAALDQIHANAKGQLVGCNCIAHQTFAGSLQSTVTCSNCTNPTVTVDPILDVQLDFPASTSNLTLAGMLRRFCAEERVDVGKGYDCGNCGGGAGVSATRKLSIKKLPNVLSFQLKRFAHNATSTKVELPVRFPTELDMRPFMEHQDLPDSLYLYDLFAVVTHEGKLDNGHYWADVLSGDEWWHCDDDKVTNTTLSEVLAQRAYMLFYVRKTLAYAEPIQRNSIIAQPNMAIAAVGGAASKGVAGKGIGGKSGHPIRGMEV